MLAAECTVIMLLVVGRIKVNSGPSDRRICAKMSLVGYHYPRGREFIPRANRKRVDISPVHPRSRGHQRPR